MTTYWNEKKKKKWVGFKFQQTFSYFCYNKHHSNSPAVYQPWRPSSVISVLHLGKWIPEMKRLRNWSVKKLIVCLFVCFFYKSLDEVSASILIFPRKSLILFDVMATFDHLFQHLGAVMPLQSAVKSTFTFTCKGCTWVKISCYRVNSHFLKSKVFIDQKSKSTILPRFVCMYILYTMG